ncbi:4965_t:CDS:2, partial [Scutellospora calospora]
DELYSNSTIKDISSEDNISISDFQSEFDTFEESINEYDKHLSTKIYMITEQLRVKEIIHTVLSMEYPLTSEDGIAIIYNIEAWDSVKVCENLNQNIKNKFHLEVDIDNNLVQLTNELANIQRNKEAKTYK